MLGMSQPLKVIHIVQNRDYIIFPTVMYPDGFTQTNGGYGIKIDIFHTRGKSIDPNLKLTFDNNEHNEHNPELVRI
jgi:hypothetical protein